MEDILFFRKGRFREYIKSSRPALGIIKDHLDNMVVLTIQASDKLYAYSDGIIETTNQNNELFGQERLIASIFEMLSSDKEIQVIQYDADEFKDGTDQLDDITLVELSV